MTMWTPRLDPSLRGITEQLVAALAADVDAGTLVPGTQLPTQRELSDRLGIALGTVTRAYAIARKRGFITSTIGRGTFVSSDAGAAADDTTPVDLIQNFVMRDPRDSILRESGHFHFDPSRMAALIDRDQTPAGSPAHREALASWVSRPGFEVHPDHIVITAGTQHAMFIVLATFMKPGEIIAAEQVTYAGIQPIASMLHLELLGLAQDAEGIIPADFDKACAAGARVLYTTPTFHNPTGITMSAARRRDVAAIAKRHDVTILEDDVYGFLAPDPPPPIAAFAPDRTFFCTSTSKSVAAGIRVGVAVCPPAAAARVAAAVRTTIWESPPVMAEMVMQWIRTGVLARIIDAKRTELLARNELAASVLGSSPHSTCAHLWLQLPSRWRPQDFVTTCQERGVLISAADAFAVERATAPNAVRVCLGAARTRERLERGLRVIADVLASTPAGFALT
jgi:DNA-binding transcriptional MocR family regulator